MQGHVQFIQCRKLPYASMYVLVCVFKIFSETIGPTEAKFHVEPQWDRGRKFIQTIPVICCFSFEYCQPLGAGAFRTAFTKNVAPQCRALNTHIPVYLTSLDKGLGTRKPIEWERLNSQLEVRIRKYLSTGKYYLLTIIKSQVYYP